uniref:Uncharacterized protein n=1 Tax=Cacopsylla melanoneura TaxID=428564 RepID=A0A8D8YRQ5_9HEMI
MTPSLGTQCVEFGEFQNNPCSNSAFITGGMFGTVRTVNSELILKRSSMLSMKMTVANGKTVSYVNNNNRILSSPCKFNEAKNEGRGRGRHDVPFQKLFSYSQMSYTLSTHLGAP